MKPTGHLFFKSYRNTYDLFGTILKKPSKSMRKDGLQNLMEISLYKKIISYYPEVLITGTSLMDHKFMP